VVKQKSGEEGDGGSQWMFLLVGEIRGDSIFGVWKEQQTFALKFNPLWCGGPTRDFSSS